MSQLRRADYVDCEQIKVLLTETRNEKTFNFWTQIVETYFSLSLDSIERLIETNVFSVVYESESSEIFGFISFSLSSDPFALDLSCFCCNSSVLAKQFFNDSCRQLFLSAQSICRISFPPSTANVRSLDFLSFDLPKKDGKWCLNRQDFLPSLFIREARIEDCDSVLPLLKKHSLIPEQSSDYELATLIESDSNTTKSFVALSTSTQSIVGFMNVSCSVDMNAVVNNYEMNKYLSLFGLQRSSFSTNTGLELKSPKITEFTSFSNLNKIPSLEVSPASDLMNTLESNKQKLNSLENLNSDSNTNNNNLFETCCIRLFCINEDFVYQSFEFMDALWNAFPMSKYCLLSLETKAREITLTDYFEAIPSRTSSESLYLTSNEITCNLNDIIVRKMMETDLKEVYDMLQQTQDEQEHLSLTKSTFHTSNHSAYLCFFRHKIIGICWIQTETDHKMICGYSDQYEMEAYLNPMEYYQNERAIFVINCHMKPLFSVFLKEFFTQIMKKEAVYFLLSKNDNLISVFSPVKPRRLVQFPNDMRDGEPVMKAFDFPLSILAMNSVHEPRLKFHTKIVVVGSSSAAFGFLEELLFKSYLHFASITLVSGDIGTFVESDKDYAEYFVSDLCYSQHELSRLGLIQGKKVKYMKSRMKFLDRHLKNVVLENGEKVHYDFLILAPGLQYHPEALSENLAQVQGVYGATREKKNEINNEIQKFLRTREVLLDDKIIIFGNNLQVFGCIAYLEHYGVLPSEIVLFLSETDPRHAKDVFENDFIHQIMFERIRDMGIEIYEGCCYEGVTISDGMLKSVAIRLRSDNKLIFKPARLFLYCDKKTVFSMTFKALNESMMVFDGNLIIDHCFKTNDPNIFGLGSITRYSSFYKTLWKHSYYNGRTVGKYLGNLMLTLFDPVLQPLTKDKMEIPELNEAKKIQCLLPDGFYFYSFSKPHILGDHLSGRKILGQEILGKVLETKIENDKGELIRYVAIHLNVTGFIRSLHYLGKEKPRTDNLGTLYNLHEKYLNNMVQRYNDGLIKDLYEYLNESWTMAIYHHNFESFKNDLKYSLLDLIKNGDEYDRLREEIEKIVSGSKLKQADELESLYEHFEQSSSRKQLDLVIEPIIKKFIPGYEK